MKTIIISGYFSPLDGGNLDFIEGAAGLGDRLVVIVNNDVQQLIKKGKILIDEESRLRILRALRYVDDAILSIDRELTVIKTVQKIATDSKYQDDELIFAQGGSRSSDKVNPESEVCAQYGIARTYRVGR